MLQLPDNSRIKKEAIVFILFFLFISFFTLVSSQAQNPFIPKYDAVKRSERCFTVTQEANNQFGAVWWADKVDFSTDTLFNFVVYMGGLDGNGADGLAFVMHQDPRDTTTDSSRQVIIGGAGTWDLEAATGDDGGGLGFAMHKSRVGPNTIPGPHGPGDDPENHKIQKSVAIEFDTWNNNDVPDGKSGLDGNLVNQPLSPYFGWDHTSVIYNGYLYGGQQIISDAQGNTGRILPLKPDYAFGSADNPDGSPHHNLEDDRCYFFQIRWKVNADGTQSLELWAGVYDGTTNTDNLFLIMTHNDDMINNVFGGNPVMRFGFTGSTGGAKNEQTICLLGENSQPFAQNDVASIPMNTPTVIDVESNDNDPDGDQLHVPIIIDPANHGLATIFDSLDVNFLRYTPNANYVGLDTVGYVTCDVNSTKCYSKCDTAYVFINVACAPFEIEANQISPNTVCSDAVPANGSASALAYLHRTIWYEGFDDLAPNTTVDNGASSWSFTKSGNCNNNGDIIWVDTDQGSKKFRVQNSGCEVVWKTEEIDISPYTAYGVEVTLNMKSKGKMENDDYLKVYYIVDGSLKVFNNGIHIAEINGTETAYINGVKGGKLQIVVEAINDSGNEEYFWDNIEVKALTPTVTGVTFDWYEGTTQSGASIYSGSVANGITDGIYTVVATDQNTACLSKPINVTIDSAGLYIQGGYVDQLSSFTNCNLPYDGALKAGILNGTEKVTIGYTFEWYYQEDPKTPFFLQSTDPGFSNLESREYSVIITENATGCDTTVNEKVINEIILPKLTATKLADITSCSDPNSGSVGATVFASGIQTIWSEDFADLNTGDIEDPGSTAWTWETPDDSSKVQYVGVQKGNDDPEIDNHLEFHETRGNLVNWSTEVIDIVGFTDVSVTLDLYASIKMNTKLAEAADASKPRFIKIYYKIDGGAKTLFSNGSHNEVEIPSPITLSLTGVNASSIQILIEVSNGGGGERYFIDNIVVDGKMPPGQTTVGFTFNWYDGPATKAIPDFVGAGHNTVPAGQYTVVAVNNKTSCVSESRSVTINDISVLPDVLVSVVAEQSSCDSLAFTGELSGSVDEAGVPTITGYSFNWYKGPNDVIPARPGYTGGPAVDSLEVGSYRLVVIADTTNCSTFVDTLIQDITVTPPDITLTTVDVTSCAISNGSITISLVGNPADYIYDIYTGFGAVSDSLLMTSNNIIISDLSVGNYTVIAKDVITKCETNPVTTTINDASVLPTTTITSQDQVSCDSSNPTGQLTASVGLGAITDYSFEWFENDPSGAPIVPSSLEGEIISDLDSGGYALRITQDITQCTNVFYSSVNLGVVLPVEVVNAIPSTNCGTAANGQLVATVDGGLTEVDGYTFIWESVDNADTLSVNAGTVTSLEPGDYMLTVINDTTTCASNPAPVTIDDNTIIPDPILTVMENSSCDVSFPNGEIQVSGINNEANPLTDYHYTWYDGNSSGPQMLPPNVSYPNNPDSSHIAGLSADTIALVITNLISTCSNELLSIINNINIKPIIDAVAVDHVDNCVTPYMSGANIVSVNGGSPVPVGFTFEWTNLDGGPVISGSGSSFTDMDLIDEVLPPGNYQVIAYNEYNCPSDLITFTIDDNAVPPTFSLSGHNNISCDINIPVGSLLASRPDASYSISSYEWFENNTSGILLSTSTPSDSILYNLDSGTYAVRISDAATGCTSVEFAGIQYTPSNEPIIQNISNIGLTSCINPNGELGFRVIPFENSPPLYTTPRTYTFYLDGSAAYNQTNAGSDRTQFINLIGGDWNAWVVDEFTHCISDTITETMADAPEIIIIADAVKLPTSCVGTDGQLNIFTETLTNDSISGGLGFNFDWFRGADGSQGAVPFTSAANKFSSNAINLISDYYFIAIEDIETGCKTDTSVFIQSITLPEFNNVSITPANKCGPFSNGSVSAELTGFSLGLGYSDYNFLLFEGPTFNTNWPTDTSGLVYSNLTPVGGPVTFPSDLKPGMYTLVVKEEFGDCFNDPVPVQIDLDFTFPEFALDIQADKSCGGAPAGTGQLEILNTTPVMPLTDFSFEWFAGSSSSALGAQTSAFLFANNYTLVGEITANIPGQGCTGDSLFSLPKVLDTLEIVELVTPNRNCAPYDGAIQFTDIEENGLGIGLPGDYVNFNIFDTDLVAYTPATGDGVATPWGGISPGNYYIQAQNDITKCLTEIVKVSIDDLAQDPVISIALNNPDYGCNVGAATGELETFATAGNQNVADYNFTWYQGDISGPAVSNLPIASNISANSSTQLYTIEIEDIAGANQGCTAAKEYTLLHQPTSVNVLITELTIDPQRNCGPSGSIMLNQIREDDGSGSIPTAPDYTGLYQARLLDSDLNVIDPAANTFAKFFPTNGTFGSNDIPAETYYVQSSNITTGCAYGPLTQVIIMDVSKDPIVSAILDSPDFSCLGGSATGQLTPTAIGGFDGDNVQTNFAMSWFEKSSGAAVPGGSIASNLMHGIYTVQVVDINGVDLGCTTSRDYTVTAARHDIDITASAQDQTICIPDGSAQIENISEDGIGIALPDAGWSVLLLDNNRKDITPALPASGFPGNPFTNISEGLYFIQALDNLTNCYSNPYQVIVDDISENPVIAIDVTTPQYSLNPNPASWTGALQANVTETATGAPDPNGYVYSWHVWINDFQPSISNLDNVGGLDKGYYTLKALSNSTGCVSRYSKYLPFEYLEPVFNTSISAQTVCSPNDGSIEVTDISLDGAPDMLSDYTFNWHHDTYASGDAADVIIPGNDVRTAYDDLKARSYYIIAKENWWMIDSYPLKVEVIDSTTNPIIIFDATNYKPLTSCDENVIANGALSVNVYEDNTNANLTPPFNYVYTWYTGSEVNPAYLMSGETSTSISGFPSGKYTVEVLNLGNNCLAENTFTIEDKSVIPIVAVSQTPNTNCPVEIANGISSANVINSVSPHKYEWYAGTEASGSPAYIGAFWKGRQAGDYTVQAFDQDLETCISEPVVIHIEDARVHPTILINELSPVTNCDPERPNGVLSALTQDGINGHTFKWYIDDTFYSEGPVSSKLGLFDYQLIVTNDVTQCITSMVSGPTQLLGTVPIPNVDILNDRTSCLGPDGIARASISGNVTDYIFRYYHKQSGVQLTNLYEEYTIYDLDTSTYLVTAENRNTGCISDPNEFAISDESYFPEIDIIVDPSNCMEPSGGANVIISDVTQEYKVTWFGENGYEEQLKEIVYIPVGKYRVEVEGSEGCFTSSEAEVKGEVLIYNGISANNDGFNDYFKVVCLEYFPDNNVKIYSRSGMLVYDQDNYDMYNEGSRFDGVSNKGANILGTELPIGTYYYVVNKNDGSKPKGGYLELVR